MQVTTLSGLILTKQQFDRDGKLVLVYWLKSEHGPVKVEVTGEQVVFFCLACDKSSLSNAFQRESILFDSHDLTLKHFNGEPVSAFYFSSLASFYDAKEVALSIGATLYEQDFRHCDRYLTERFIKGQAWAQGSYQKKRGVHCLYNAKLAKYDSQSIMNTPLSVISLDIECSGLGVLYSIGLYSDSVKHVIMIGQGETLPWLEWVDDELALLARLNTLIHQYDPDVIIGWNVIDFDFVKLAHRAAELGVTLNLGRLKSNMRISQSQINKLLIPGRVVLDGIDMLKNASYHFSSYRLGQVAEEVLGESKLIQGGDTLSEIERQFKYEKVKLAEYNLQDCKLVWDIFGEKSLLEFAIARAKLTGLDLHRLGGSVAAFTNLYLPLLHRAGYIAPNLGETPVIFESPGGYVMDSKPGLYHGVIVLDYKSLYPSIIRTFKIDPLGLVEGLDDKNSISGFNGAKFSRTRHFVPQLLAELWHEREVAKTQKNETMSYAIKIIMNSFYGVLGSNGCRFYDPRLSSSITMRGHEIMKTTRTLIEQKGYEVIYGDTDSTFVALPSIKDDGYEIGKQLAKEINHYWHTTLQTAQLESILEIEFETFYKPFFMPTLRGETTGSKKRYAGINQEGELVFKGLEAARGDWTQLAKDFQIELYRKVFSNEACESFILETVLKLKQGKLDHKLIYRKRLGQAVEKYQRAIPPHVKALRDYQSEHASFILKRGDWVDYIITTNGPLYVAETSVLKVNNIDYQHYLDKQLKPIVEALEGVAELRFEQLVSDQKTLF